MFRWGVVLAAFVSAGGPAHGARWWSSAWRYQREVTIPASKPRQFPGDDVAVVTFPTGGLAKADGSDVRVASDAGREMPSRVLMVGPGDQVRVAFAVLPGVTHYYVYYGNTSPHPGKKLDIRRGVLLETWAYSGSIPKTFSKAQEAFRRAKRLIGRDFRENVFLGYNPFGPTSGIASIFTGYVQCDKAGRHSFSVMSRNAAFLEVDGKLLVSNGGTRKPNRRSYRTAGVTLTAGVHKLTFYHVNGHGDPVAVLAWQQPGSSRPSPIPSRAFTPVIRATCGLMKRYGSTLDVDFIPVHAGETFMKTHYYQRYTFDARTVGKAARSIRWKWDFGDGQTSDRQKVDHVYLLQGEYTVTLTARTHLGERKRTNRIFVTRNWARVTRSALDKLSLHANILAGYDFSAMAPAAVAQAMDLLKRAGNTEGMVRAGKAFLTHDSVGRTEAEIAIPMYADALLADGAPDEAAAALTRGAKIVKSPSTRAMLLHRAGRICLDELDDTATAMNLFSDVVKKYSVLTTSHAVRGARIGIGDVWRTRGDYDRAAKAYSAAKGRGKVTEGRQPIVKGDLARHVEDYIRQRDLTSAEEYLRRWEETFPLDKLEGYWSLLAARLDLARKRHAAVVREAETLARVNPGSNYAAELLMMAANSHGKLGRKARADAVLRRIAEKYPESPLAGVAVRKLGEAVEPEKPDRMNKPDKKKSGGGKGR